MLADTHDEQSAWDAIRALSPQRKMAVAFFLKVLQPIKTLIGVGNDTGVRLQRFWENSYAWLSREERRRIMRFAAKTAAGDTRPFQKWLEETALNLILDPGL
jgi:hypothetical protein